MAVAPPDERPAPAPEWETIDQAFAALESPLLAFAQGITRDLPVAEDLVQEAFMRLHTRFAEVQAPRAWLYRTVHNLAVDHQRRVSRLVPLPPPGETGAAEAADDTQPLPDEQIARCENIGLVRLVLQTLDERSREIIRLRFHEELSYQEISGRTGLKTGHVGYLLHHALKAVAAELERTEVAP